MLGAVDREATSPTGCWDRQPFLLLTFPLLGQGKESFKSIASKRFSSPVPGSSAPSQDIVAAVMGILKSRKCGAGFPGCDGDG